MGEKMSNKTTFGTRNSITVAAAQPMNDIIILTKVKDKFEKTDSEIVTLKRCEIKTTTKGTVMVCLGIEGKNIDPLFITPMKGVRHLVDNGEKKFWKNEATNKIAGIKAIDGKAVFVPKNDVINILNGLDYGTKVCVQMDNGFVLDGKVCDLNRTRRFQFSKIVEAIGDKLGLTIGKADLGSGVADVILRQGKPITYEEFNQLFRERGVGATIQCRFSKNNLTGKTSLYDIQIPENR